MYKQLREWHAAFGDQFEILLYPSDEFGRQELPEGDIPSFVESKGLPTDGGGCTLMSKVNVNGPATDPVWQLAKSAFPGDIGWNFAGIFLFDKEGKPIARFSSKDLQQVEDALKEAIAA